MSLAEFFHMGGYAFYVWTSYALAALVLAANVVSILRRERRVREQLARRARRRRS
ncbi:heme exporter protein CcmD [Inmirania thermothiophila]|uniref:Heme exporter protein D n=1 Tax=Inmirania thermothiophila TaxID=1750597 RepID=A0A3N1XTJ1_9GAMM|nr:heme exporter protein CcmD [Inmirania thermothiophila]ROR29481.1 heme exporter protein D [Inmirania thermothiophila]